MTSDRLTSKRAQRHARFHIWFVILAIMWPGLASFSQSTNNQPGVPIDVTARELEENQIQNNWLSYHGDLTGRRYSGLRQITRDNVGQVELKWVFHSRKVEMLGVTPVVVGGVMYVTASNDLFALDGLTGAVLWHRTQADGEGREDHKSAHINRGVAVLSSNLYMETDDGHLLALDARSGNLLWDVPVSEEHANFAGAGAPLAVQEKIIVGSSGGKGQGDFVAAFDASSGREVWRFRMERQKSENDSDSSTAGGLQSLQSSWMPGTYDAALGLLFEATGSEVCNFPEYAQLEQLQHGGCLIALDVSTGRLKWQSQLPDEQVPSSAISQVPVLVDVFDQGAVRKEIIVAQSNGYLTIFDRKTGHVIRQRNFEESQSPAEQGDRKQRRVTKRPMIRGEVSGDCLTGKISPTWNPPSFSEQSHFFYFTGLEKCRANAAQRGAPRFARVANLQSGSVGVTTLFAYDPFADTSVWKNDSAIDEYGQTGTVTTASGLLLSAGQSDTLSAMDASTGKALWSFPMGQSATGAPISYAIENRQYFAVAAGNDLFIFGLP